MVDAVTSVTPGPTAVAGAVDPVSLQNPALAQAFNQALVGFAAAILQPAIGDSSDATNDTTSEPDGPGGSG